LILDNNVPVSEFAWLDDIVFNCVWSSYFNGPLKNYCVEENEEDDAVVDGEEMAEHSSADEDDTGLMTFADLVESCRSGDKDSSMR
jgi:hypothetical protein